MTDEPQEPLERAGKAAYDAILDFKELLVDAQSKEATNKLQVLCTDLQREFEKLASMAYSRGLYLEQL